MWRFTSWSRCRFRQYMHHTWARDVQLFHFGKLGRSPTHAAAQLLRPSCRRQHEQLRQSIVCNNIRHLCTFSDLGGRLPNETLDGEGDGNYRKNKDEEIGLFGLAGLVQPEDFDKIAQNSLNAIAAIRNYLEEHPDLPVSETLALLDAISSELCSAIDAAELCRNVHSSPEYVHQAELAFEKLSHFIHQLNADASLHRRLVEIMEDEYIWQTGSSSISAGRDDTTPSGREIMAEEEKIFTIDLRREFEADGIHLEGKARSDNLLLQAQVVEYETKYSQGLMHYHVNSHNNNNNNNNNNNHDDDNEKDKSVLAIGPFRRDQQQHVFALRQWLSQFVPRQPITSRASGDTSSSDDLYVHIDANQRNVVSAVMNGLEDANLREQLWRQCYHHPRANISALVGLVRSRHQLAKSVGHRSYAHKYLANKAVLGTPEQVQALLTELSTASAAQMRVELQQLATVKRHLHLQQQQQRYGGGGGENGWGLNSSFSDLFSGRRRYDSDSNVRGGSAPLVDLPTLDPWDMSYLIKHAPATTTTTGNDTGTGGAGGLEERARQYFPLDACIEGLQLISHELFGIILEPTIMQPSEAWAFDTPTGTTGTDNPTTTSRSTSKIQKYSVIDARNDGKQLGTVYFDLFSRPGKFPGAAHFTVQCGCARTIPTGGGRGGGAWTQVHQLPVVALVFHFNASSSSSSQPLLRLHEVETLHHEWGHALHSLLSSTRFQHLSGTRGGADFIEIPSHWMEYFARSSSVVQRWARHHRTGERIPVPLLEQALQSSKRFAAVDLQTQILFSAADQYLFGTTFSGADADMDDDMRLYRRLVHGVGLAQQEYTLLPTAVDSSDSDGDGVGVDMLPHMNILHHGHFVNYGGGYYSYLFAKMHAAQIWHTHFAADPLNSSAGAFLRDTLLAPGSSRPAAEILREMGGFAVSGGGQGAKEEDPPLDPSYYLRTILTPSTTTQ